MANKEYTLGSVGPFTYDDTLFPAALETTGVIRADTAPSDGSDVVRLDDLGTIFAPFDASYVVIGLDANLTNERVLAVNATNLGLTDGGAGGNVTLDTVQDIDVSATPTFAGMTLSAIPADTDNTVVISVAGVLSSDEIDPKVWAIKLVDYAGTPVGQQIALFTDVDTIGGDANFTWDGAIFSILGSMLFDGAQDYKLKDPDRGASFTIQSQSSGADSLIELYSKDGDGTDHVSLELFLKGVPGDITTALESLTIRGVDSGTGAKYSIYGSAVGTGSLHAIHLNAKDGISGTQLVLATDGNVGIGTTSPAAPLDIAVNGITALRISDSGDSGNLRAILGESSGNGGFFVAYSESETATAVIRGYASSDIQAFFTAGNVGINTAIPAVKFQVVGESRFGDQATNYMTIESDGDVNFVGGAGLQLGEIYAHDNAVGTTIGAAGKANKVQVTIFDTDGLSNGSVTPSHSSDHITIGKAGFYFVCISLSVSSAGGGADDMGYSLWKNNGTVEFENLHTHRQMSGGAGDRASISLSGIVDVAANDTLEVWLWNEDNTEGVVIDDITLSVFQIGGT